MAKRYSIVFACGGHGTGKGTQCARISAEFGYAHLSVGDLLREEQGKGGELADQMLACMKEGKLVPGEVSVKLIKKAMEASANRNFLIDGFPRSKDNLRCWFDEMEDLAEIKAALFFKCPEEVMKERLMEGSQTSGRPDDNEETIAKRLRTFQEESMPVVDLMDLLGLLRVINCVPPPEVVFTKTASVLRGLGMLPVTERTLMMVKPDAVGNEEAILGKFRAEGLVVVSRCEKTLTTSEVQQFYKEHEGKQILEPLVEFMISGPVVAFCLEGVGAVAVVRKMLGPADVACAKEEAPQSIRAEFGTDAIKNAAHGSDSLGSACGELEFFFNAPLPSEQTLAIIKPMASALHSTSFLDCIAARGFMIEQSRTFTFSPALAREFYAEHEGKPFFSALLSFMTSSECTALVLERPSAIHGWRALLGPPNSEVARLTRPDTLRAMYGVDGTVNAGHGSDSPESAARELGLLFPDPRRRSGNPASEALLKYVEEKVDPVMSPLLQKIIQARPSSVAPFILEKLKDMPERLAG
ncbi:unnamed protein product [Chrysoparadoxa australica]